MTALTVIATVLQLVGLVAAGVGLWRAWKRRNRALGALVAATLGRELVQEAPIPKVPVPGIPATGTVGVTALPREVGSVEERLDRHSDLLSRLKAEASNARSETETSIENIQDRLTRELAQARSDLQQYVQDEAANGVPLSARGLLITAVGTALQIVPALMAGG